MEGKSAQTLLDAVFEVSDDAVFVKDLDGRYLLANRAMAQRCGCPVDELAGLTVADLFPPEVARPLMEADRRVLESGEPLTAEEHLPVGDGTRIYLTRKVPHRDSQGQIVGLLGIGRDITERVRAEEALRERVKELNCLYGISALVEQPGASLAEILQGAAGLIPPAWQYPEIAAARIVLEDREFRTANFREGCPWRQVADLVVHGQRQGGVEVCYPEERPERDEGPFLTEERSLLEAIAERLGRVVERLRAERVLHESEARLQVLATSTPAYIYELDASGTILFANRTYAGLTREQVVGTSLLDWFPKAQRPRIQSLIEQTFDSGQPQSTQYTIPNPQGEMRSYAAEVLPVLAGDGVAAAVLTATDISERVRAEEALREAHNGLESRVQERTAALQEMNVILAQEVVQRRHAQGELQRANRALHTLSACNRALARAVSEPDLLQDICRIVVEDGGYRLAWVGFAEQDEAKTVRPVAQAGFEEGYLATLDITWADSERGRGPTGRAIRTGRPAPSRNLLTDPRFAPWRAEATRRGYASSLALPLKASGQALGSLNIYAAEADAFDSQETQLLSDLADNVAFGLSALRTRAERRRAEGQLAAQAAELSRSNAFLSSLNQVSTRIQSASERGGILEALGAELWTLGLVSVVALLEADDSALVIRHISAPPAILARAETLIGTEFCGQRLRRDAWPASETLDGGRAVFVPDPRAVMAGLLPHLSHTPLWRAARRAGVSADHRAVCLPLAYEDQVLGVLAVMGADLQEGDVPALSVFASQVAAAFERVRLTREAAEAEILREVDRLRSELIANVSHELRTPLGLIEIFGSSLLMEDLDLDAETQRQFLGGIREETSRLTALVDNLLNLSQMESGRYRLDRRPADLGQLASEVLATLEIQVVDHRLVHDFPPAPLVAEVDAKQIEQVLRNLLSNAIRYSPGGGTITVQGYRAADRVVVCIGDEGIGIPAEEQERIFERFYRVDTELAREVSGVGLGLAVCEGIVDAHEGRIWVESSPGQGSRFYFALPV